MKLLDRYIIRELIVPFIAGSFAIALLFAANQLIFILKTFSVQNVPVIAMVQMILYRMPFWLNMTLPAGISLAASLAITRLTRESEVTAMRAAGVRVFRVVLPVALFGILVSIGNYVLVEKIMPETEQKAAKIEIEVGIANASPTFQSNVWITLRQYRATFGTVTRQSDDTLLIQNVVLGERESGDSVRIISAPTGSYKSGIWTFHNVKFWHVTPSSNKITGGTGESMTVPQPIFINDIFEGGRRSQDKSSAELITAIRLGKQAGRDMTREEIELHNRYSIPASCVVFAIVAPIFALVFARSGGFVGVLLSFILVLLYYNSFVISTEIFGRNHWVSPWLAAWLPNLVFGALGLLGLRRLE